MYQQLGKQQIIIEQLHCAGIYDGPLEPNLVGTRIHIGSTAAILFFAWNSGTRSNIRTNSTRSHSAGSSLLLSLHRLIIQYFVRMSAIAIFWILLIIFLVRTQKPKNKESHES